MSLADHVARIQSDAAKVLTIDIERAPGEAYWYDPRIDYLRAGNVKTNPRTVCFAARWYGRTRPIFAADWQGDNPTMLEKAWQLYDQADIVYTYNGRKFDDKHLRAEWLVAGMPPPRPWKSVDLLAVVRRQFGFEHKSLDAVTRRLGRPGKAHPFDLQMMLDACNGNKQKQRETKLYNIGDVELTEWLADRIRPYIWSHPHTANVGDGKACHACGSQNLTLDDTTRNLAILIYRALYRCDNCGANVVGGWHSRAATTRGVA